MLTFTKNEKIIIVGLAGAIIVGALVHTYKTHVAWRISHVRDPVPVTVRSPEININTASATELMALRGIGPVTAERIVLYRRSDGLYIKKEDIMKVKGIGKATFAKIKDEITVSGASR
ncbi:MAG: helix-hairpin-helix domain-containing protein [Candidatus Omnitrophica bacterium]|nr:helix-hairpin-helix domain-containing protein [Candidatus Omnitrophota bacterium]